VRRFSPATITDLLGACNAPGSNAERGRAFENLLSYLFECIPGITITKRNALNQFENEEIDIAFWNERTAKGLPFLSEIILVEAKNWSGRVGSMEVAWFDRKIEDRGQDFGILVAMNGITGNGVDRTNAHQVIANALGKRRRLIVITRDDIQNIATAKDIVLLIKERLCQLTVNGTLFA
jgi:hypothetical protein